MPSLLRTNPVSHERKDTASVQRKKIEAVDKASKEDMGRSFDTIYKLMMPRLTPIIAAWVRSLAPSFDNIPRTRPLTVSSVSES
jgi:hypothetical protein